ncbi:MAG: AAA family ATPase [Rhodospirillaceae bacterium]
MTHAILVINQKGGVGKTATAIPLVDHLRATDSGYLIVDADCQSDADAKSSLGAFFPGVRQMAISASPDALKIKPSLAVAHWDGLYELTRASNLLVDFGANVASSLLAWIDRSEIADLLAEDGVSLDVVVVATAHPDAVADALTILRRLLALKAPTMRLFLALNSAAGPFDAYSDSPEQAEFSAMVEAGDLTMVVVPLCGSEVWRDCERHRITPLRAATMSADELAAILKTPRLETRRGRGELSAWHRDVVDSFVAAGLLPDTREEQAA